MSLVTIWLFFVQLCLHKLFTCYGVVKETMRNVLAVTYITVFV